MCKFSPKNGSFIRDVKTSEGVNFLKKKTYLKRTKPYKCLEEREVFIIIEFSQSSFLNDPKATGKES